MKKITLITTLAVDVLLASNVLADCPQGVDACGECGEGCTWEKTGTSLTIVGEEGAVMDNFPDHKDSSGQWVTDAPWGTDVTQVSLQGGLTNISDCAFEGTSITSIEIPKSVTSIGFASFYGLSSLSSVNFEEGSQLQTIGSSAFDRCGFSSFDIPDTVTSIGPWAFGHNLNLTNLVLPDGLTSLGYAFLSRSNNVSSVILPASLFADGAEGVNLVAFGYSQVTQIYCPEGNQECLSYQLPICPDGVTDANENLCVYAKDAPNPTYMTYTQGADGKYILNGKKYNSFDDMQTGVRGISIKRIYTVEEASKLSKPTGNTFRIRYK